MKSPAPDITEQFNRTQDTNGPERALKNPNLHWAGHRSGSCQELARECRPRVYYDPRERPDLFITQYGEPPTAPLPDLDLNGHLEDPEPWLDPNTGNRLTCGQARTAKHILKYEPRKKQPTSKGRENREGVQLERLDTVAEPPSTTSPSPARSQGAHEMVGSSR